MNGALGGCAAEGSVPPSATHPAPSPGTDQPLGKVITRRTWAGDDAWSASACSRRVSNARRRRYVCTTRRDGACSMSGPLGRPGMHELPSRLDERLWSGNRPESTTHTDAPTIERVQDGGGSPPASRAAVAFQVVLPGAFGCQGHSSFPHGAKSAATTLPAVDETVTVLRHPTTARWIRSRKR